MNQGSVFPGQRWTHILINVWRAFFSPAEYRAHDPVGPMNISRDTVFPPTLYRPWNPRKSRAALVRARLLCNVHTRTSGPHARVLIILIINGSVVEQRGGVVCSLSSRDEPLYRAYRLRIEHASCRRRRRRRDEPNSRLRV